MKRFPPTGIALRYDAHTQVLLQGAGISQKDRAKLGKLFHEQSTMSLPHFEAFLAERGPEIVAKTNIYQRIRIACALSHYHQQRDFPVVEWLLSDDAVEYADGTPATVSQMVIPVARSSLARELPHIVAQVCPLTVSPIQYAVIATNAVNVAMTIIVVSIRL